MASAVTGIAYPIHDLLRRRWSPVAFAPRPVEPEKLRSLFEAARWAPSSFNEQPWSFIVATRDREVEFQKLQDCLVEGNAVWAQHAPVLMLSVAKLYFERSGKPNRHAFHDVGQAIMGLIVQATSLDLYVHQMAGFSVEKAREAFAVPEGHEPVAAIALGYLGDPSNLPEPLQQRQRAQRTRKPAESFVFSGKWGKAAEITRTAVQDL